MVLGPTVLFQEKIPLETNGVLPDKKEQINTSGRIWQCNIYYQLKTVMREEYVLLPFQLKV